MGLRIGHTSIALEKAIVAGLLCMLVLSSSCRLAHRPAPAGPTGMQATSAVEETAELHAPARLGPPTDVERMVGEWERVESILLSWHADAWSYLPVYLTLVQEASHRARVLIFVSDPADRELIRFHVAAAGAHMASVELIDAPLDSVWIRDYGPFLVRTHDRRLRAIDMPYDRVDDDRLPALVATHSGWMLSKPPVQLDGGHLQSDGEGRCIITDEVFALNAEMGIHGGDVERALRDYLGCRSVISIPALEDEETGHVDLMVYVTAPRKVLVGRYRRWEDPVNHRHLEKAARILREAGFEVTRIPMPANDRRQVFRSYTNALTVNDAVFVPVYSRDRRYERAALRRYREAFPGRVIIPVVSDEVIEMGGALHCISLTVPAL